jgi:hypothetical protein
MPGKETRSSMGTPTPKNAGEPKILSIEDIAKSMNPTNPGSETMFVSDKMMNPNPEPEMFAPEGSNGSTLKNLDSDPVKNNLIVSDILAELKASVPDNNNDSKAETVYDSGEHESKQPESKPKPAPASFKKEIKSIIESPMVQKFKNYLFEGGKWLSILFMAALALLSIYKPVTSLIKRSG